MTSFSDLQHPSEWPIASQAALQHIEDVLAQYNPISLSEMQAVSLQDRVDTKYVMGLSQFSAVLGQLTDLYRVFTLNEHRIHQYQTLYFDTPDFAIYQHHHNGVGSRYKIRARKYVESDLAFFEIKHKTNQRRTIKSRLMIPDIVTQIQGEVDAFLDTHTPFEGEALQPKLWNDYLRITLVSTQREERLTLDLNVAFSCDQSAQALPGLVIAEVKQAHLSQNSDFIRQMRRFGIRPISFSKYTAGVYTLYDHVKTNNFKPQIRHVNQVIEKELNHGFVC
jgi:hypothetical protein